MTEEGNLIMSAVHKVVTVGTALVTVILCALVGYGMGINSAEKYRECRKLASIETCVVHVGLEKSATASQR